MAQNSIRVKNYLNIEEEKVAAAAITPGMLLELTSSDTVQAHATAGGNAAPKMFALEDELQGNGIADAYAAAAPVKVWIPQPGDQVYAILADGNDVSIGDLLESNGAGFLQKHAADVESFESGEAGAITVYPEQIVGVAVEAVDTGDSSDAEESSDVLGYAKRIIVRIV